MPEDTPASAANVTLARLEDQFSWYDRKSISASKKYRCIKVTEILAAALIPFLGSLSEAVSALKPHVVLVSGILGVLVTVLEGILHLNQYQKNWISYRNTAEALKREKYLYLAGAGAYANAPNPLACLAERIEALMSQEGVEWTTLQLEAAREQVHSSEVER